MTEERAKVADKVRKLLARTVNNPSQAEAETALLKAQEMLVKNGMTLEDLGEGIIGPRTVERTMAHEPNKTPWWYGQLALVLADNFRCFTYITGLPNRKAIMFMGFPEDIEVAKACFQYAVLFINYQTQRVRKDVRKQGRDTKGVANDYISGFITGLRDKFKEQVDTNQWALVLVRPQELVQAIGDMDLQPGKRHQYTRRHDADAYNRGYQHGKNFTRPEGALKEGE